MQNSNKSSSESPLDVNPFKKPEFDKLKEGLGKDFVACLRFYTRIPLPEATFGPHTMPDFSTAARAVPLVGAVVGLIGLVAVVFFSAIGLYEALVASLTLAVLILATGAFHEDGLADTADGLGGGATVEKKLEIMKDSRLGTYGATALFLSLAVRLICLFLLLEEFSPLAVGLLIVGIETVSRTSALSLGAFLPPAREDGAAFAAGVPTKDALLNAATLTLLIVVITIWTAVGLMPTVILTFSGVLASLGAVMLAKAQLGGQTGDLAGAAQQFSALAMLIMATIFI